MQFELGDEVHQLDNTVPVDGYAHLEKVQVHGFQLAQVFRQHQTDLRRWMDAMHAAEMQGDIPCDAPCLKMSSPGASPGLVAFRESLRRTACAKYAGFENVYDAKANLEFYDYDDPDFQLLPRGDATPCVSWTFSFLVNGPDLGVFYVYWPVGTNEFVFVHNYEGIAFAEYTEWLRDFLQAVPRSRWRRDVYASLPLRRITATQANEPP